MTEYETQLMNKKLTNEKYLLCPCGSKLKLDQVRRQDKRNIYRHFMTNKHQDKYNSNPELFTELKFDSYFFNYIEDNINNKQIEEIQEHLLTKYTLDEFKFLFKKIKFEYEDEDEDEEKKNIDNRYFIDYIKENINSMELRDIVYHLLTKYSLDDIIFLFKTILKFEVKNTFDEFKFLFNNIKFDEE